MPHYIGTMLGTSIVVPTADADQPRLTFRNDVFMAATNALLNGRASDIRRAEVAGISRTTLNRLRDGNIQLSLRRALMMANRLGLNVGQLFEIATADTDAA